MRSSNLAVLALILGLMALSFVAGAGFASRFGTPPGSGSEVRLAQFPGDVFANESALVALQDRDAASLTPIETFWQVLNRVRERYYQPIPDEDKLAYGAAKGLMNALDDPYSRFLDPEDLRDFGRVTEGELEGIGAILAPGEIEELEIRHVIILRPFPGGPAEQAGILPGDLIAGVGDSPDTIESVLGETVDEVANRIRGPQGTSVFLSIVRDLDEPAIQIEVKRSKVEVPVVETKRFGSVAYIKLDSFSEQSVRRLSEGLTSLEEGEESALIIDLRGNGGGLLDAARDIVSMFVQEGPVVYIQEREGNAKPLLVRSELYRGYEFPIVVLVNQQTASASEILSGALRDTKRATLIGETTFGKGLVQTVIPLSNGTTAMSITTAKYLTPNKTDINRDGIEPDFRVPLTMEEFIALNRGELSAESDKQLQAALEFLETGAVPTNLLAPADTEESVTWQPKSARDSTGKPASPADSKPGAGPR